MIRTAHLFAGAGGGIYADLILGHKPVLAVENNPECCKMLEERKREGWWPELDIQCCDIREFDFSPWAGRVDQIAAGFPCQDISYAGSGDGIRGSRSGLVWEVFRAIDAIRPRWVFLENSPAIRTKGRREIIAALVEKGYSWRDGTLAAAHVGAGHLRNRWWLLAADALRQRSQKQRRHGFNAKRADAPAHRIKTYAAHDHGKHGNMGGLCSGAIPQLEEAGLSDSEATPDAVSIKRGKNSSARHNDNRYGPGWQKADGGIGPSHQDVADADRIGRHGRIRDFAEPERRPESADDAADSLRDRLQIAIQRGGLSESESRTVEAVARYTATYYWSPPDAGVLRVVDGVPARRHRIQALGNAQVPLQAAMAWILLMRGGIH